jgi:hypothetical protein
MKINSKLMGFGAGTQILMADGSHKAIENIKTGDMVLSFSQLDAFGQLEPKRVLNTFMRVDRNPLKVSVPDTEIELMVAPGQLFINSNSSWKEASNINEIIDNTGNVHKFDVNQITRGKHQMFDIIVEDNHSLIANGVRVHNMTYSVEDVKQGRADPGRSSDYYRRDDLENTGDSYQHGKSKKKRGKRKGRDNRLEVKVDGTITASKLLSSVEDLTDVISEIVEETTPANLTPIKLTMQNSVDSIVNYMASYTNSIVNASMSTYDKSEVLDMAEDFVYSATTLRKPFEETVVSAGGKLIAMNQLATMDLLIVRMFRILEDYTGPADADTGLFNVELDGQNTLSSKKKRFKASRAANGQYQEGGSRSDVGGNSSRGSNRGTSGGGPGPSRNTNPTKTPGQRPAPTGGRGKVTISSEDRYRTDRATAPRLSSGGQFENSVDRLNTSNSTKQYIGAPQGLAPMGPGYGNSNYNPNAGMPAMDSSARARRDRSDSPGIGPGQGTGGVTRSVNRTSEASRAGNGGGGLGSPGASRSSSSSSRSSGPGGPNGPNSGPSRSTSSGSGRTGNPANSGSGSNPTSGPSSRSSSSSRSTGSATSNRSSSNFCFAYNTMFKMADGSLKAIQDIQIGDNMLVGGKVLTTIVSDGTLEDWYIYNDIKLTGSHPILNKDGKWRKVCETTGAIPTITNDRTYILINENHKLVAHNGEMFTDYLMIGMENKQRAELYYKDFDNLFRLLNNEDVIKG